MPETVKRDRRFDLGDLARLLDGPHLVRVLPPVAVVAEEHRLAALPPRCRAVEERLALIRKRDVAGLSALALGDQQRPRVDVEVPDLCGRELRVTTPREERRLDELPEVCRAGVDQPPALVSGEESDLGRVHVRKRLHAAPGVV